MAFFLDTSALAKLYHQEEGTDRLEALAAGHVLVISRLVVLELHSVMARKLSKAEVTREGIELVLRRFRGEVRRRRFGVVALRVRHYLHAEKLLETHGSESGLRRLDALHLSVALDLKRNGLIEQIIVSDRVLCKVAPLEGLPVANPETSRPDT